MTADPADASGTSPLQGVTLVLGTSAGGTGAHVRMLAAGLVRRGIAVSVAGPSSVNARFSFSVVPSVTFSAVEISDRPRAGDIAGILRLRKLLLRAGKNESRGTPQGESGDASLGGGCVGTRHVVHAHGVRAGALAVLALLFVRAGRRPRVVVTAHNAPPNGGGVARVVYRVLESVVARGADLVLCVSPDLELRMRTARARRVERAVIAAADASPDPAASSSPDTSAPAPEGSGVPVPDVPAASAGEGRPVVLAAGRLTAQKGHDVLLAAAAGWRDLDPTPLVVIAGDGPLAGELRARADALGVDAVFLGQRDDVPALLAAAAVFVLPSQWEGQPLVLQEALRAGAATVATRVGGVAWLTGDDAALLVPPGDARALAAAVRSVLTDPVLAARLRAAARARAAALPTEEDAATAVLAAYAGVIR